MSLSDTRLVDVVDVLAIQHSVDVQDLLTNRMNPLLRSGGGSTNLLTISQEPTNSTALHQMEKSFIDDMLNSVVRDYGQSDEMAIAEVGLGLGVLIGSIVLSIAVLCSLAVFRIRGSNRGRSPKTCGVLGVYGKEDEGCDERGVEREDLEDAKSSEDVSKTNKGVAGTEGAYRSDSDSDDEEESEKLAVVAQKRSRKAGDF